MESFIYLLIHSLIHFLNIVFPVKSINSFYKILDYVIPWQLYSIFINIIVKGQKMIQIVKL